MSTPVSAASALPAQGLADPVLSFGLNGVSDWTTQMPFIDIAHNMRDSL